MKGRYPVCCLFLEIDPAAVDVNIHPAKREVKFHREFEVRKFVAQAVRETLLAFHSGPAKANSATESQGAQRPKFQQPEIIPPEIAPEASAPALLNFPEKLKPAPAVQSQTSSAAPPPVQSEIQNPKIEIFPSASPAKSAVASPPSAPAPLLNVPLRLVGVIGKLYVILESDRGLVLLDQHAAHERILFEQMMNRIESNAAVPSQKLLLPETIELPPRDAQFLREQLAVLTRLGVGLSEFGERTFLLDALPPFVKVPDARRFVFDLVDELRAAGREVNLARLGEHTVAKTVCRHAVKANDPLGGPELENLVEDLRRCAMPYTCPHGRPTLIEMNYRELEKKFGRTQ
jgi:DNA mismatch repair protein MutL